MTTVAFQSLERSQDAVLKLRPLVGPRASHSRRLRHLLLQLSTLAFLTITSHQSLPSCNDVPLHNDRNIHSPLHLSIH